MPGSAGPAPRKIRGALHGTGFLSLRNWFMRPVLHDGMQAAAAATASGFFVLILDSELVDAHLC